MKKILFLLIAFACTIATKAQTINPDARLSEVFDASYISMLQDKNPFLLERFNYYLDNAWFISEVPESKPEALNSLSQVKVADLAHINILKLEKDNNIKRSYEAYTYYRIEGTRKMIVFLPEKEFAKKFNKVRHIVQH